MNPRREPRLRPLLGAAEIGAMPEVAFQHPLNARAVRLGRSLGDATGLSRVGVHLVRVRPGNETTEFHVHRCAEEFVYILSGRGIADLGEESVEVGAGDFMGFAAGGVPHSMLDRAPLPRPMQPRGSSGLYRRRAEQAFHGFLDFRAHRVHDCAQRCHLVGLSFQGLQIVADWLLARDRGERAENNREEARRARLPGRPRRAFLNLLPHLPKPVDGVGGLDLGDRSWH